MLKKEYDKLKREKKALIAREYQDLPINIDIKPIQTSVSQVPQFFDNGVLLTSAVISIIVLLLIL